MRIDYNALWAEIQANPACAPYITLSEPKGPAEIARANDQAIADIISTGRTKVVSREVGDGAIALALGTQAGPLFIYKLRRLAATTLPDDATDEQIIPVAVAQQAVESLAKVGFDVGNPDVRAGLSMFEGTLLTAVQIKAIKALAEIPDPITADDVSRAVRGPRE